ncbi:MAG: ribosome recycling factor [Ruminococcaceae bacterium]|nr:ribosome recycling factor [Oscillospiraceae bacterium]
MGYNTKDIESKMQKSIASYEENLASIRASQANPAVLNRVTFDYWGAPTEITAMAGISVADAKTLVITPYDASTLKAIEKAILTSDIGITPANDGKVIRLVFPQLTEERRRDLAKQVQRMGEDAKVAIRNLRRTANDEIKKQKKDNLLTEDDVEKAEKAVQDLTDKYIKNIDTLTAKKEKDILTV